MRSRLTRIKHCRQRPVHRRLQRPCAGSAGFPTRGKPDVFNTDQGSQFTSAVVTGVLANNGITISMDRKVVWPDNVFVERLWRRPGIGRDRRRHLLPDPRLVDLPRHTANPSPLRSDLTGSPGREFSASNNTNA